MNHSVLIIDKPYLGLSWLIRLRWLAVTGQLITCIFAASFFHFDLPVGVLAACLLITIVSNIPLALFQSRLPCSQKVLTPLILALDTSVLTIMLYWTGGAHNPFCVFYLLHISMAAILLPQMASALAVLLCSSYYGLLFLSPHRHLPRSWRSPVRDRR